MQSIHTPQNSQKRQSFLKIFRPQRAQPAPLNIFKKRFFCVSFRFKVLTFKKICNGLTEKDILSLSVKMVVDILTTTIFAQNFNYICGK